MDIGRAAALGGASITAGFAAGQSSKSSKDWAAVGSILLGHAFAD